MNAGPEEKAIGGKERIVLRSYIFTRGSGKGRDFLIEMSLFVTRRNTTRPTFLQAQW